MRILLLLACTLPSRSFGSTPDVLASRTVCGEVRGGVAYLRARAGRSFIVDAR